MRRATIQSTVTERADGTLVYLLTCPCVTVRGQAAPWEPATQLWQRLAAEHRRRAPLCPHRLPVREVVA